MLKERERETALLSKAHRSTDPRKEGGGRGMMGWRVKHAQLAIKFVLFTVLYASCFELGGHSIKK